MSNSTKLLIQQIKTLTEQPISAEDHLWTMRCAEHIANQSDQPEKVGAVLKHQGFRKVVLGNDDYWLGTGQYHTTHAFNRAPTDDTNAHHAEFFVSKLPDHEVKGATLYVTRRPCSRCTAMLLPLGLKAIYYRDAQPEMGHLSDLVAAGVLVDGELWNRDERDKKQRERAVESAQVTWAKRWQVSV